MKQVACKSSLKNNAGRIKMIKHRAYNGLLKNIIKRGCSERERYNTLALVKKQNWL